MEGTWGELCPGMMCVCVCGVMRVACGVWLREGSPTHCTQAPSTVVNPCTDSAEDRQRAKKLWVLMQRTPGDSWWNQRVDGFPVHVHSDEGGYGSLFSCSLLCAPPLPSPYSPSLSRTHVFPRPRSHSPRSSLLTPYSLLL